MTEPHMDQTNQVVWANAFAMAWIIEGNDNKKASEMAESVLRMSLRRCNEGELYL